MNIKYSIKNVLFSLGIMSCGFAGFSQSVSAEEELTPRDVAEKFDHVLRKSHNTMMVKFKLGTCKYVVNNDNMKCTEKPRVRVVENVLKYFGNDVRALAILQEPARDKGIGMLGWEYYDNRKNNDNWIYLPALNKVKRVVSSTDSRDSGSYFGSEFYIEDLQWRKLDDYTYKILGEEDVKVLEVGKGYVDRPGYILEWMPTKDRVTVSNYGKLVTWIDKERFILLKADLYDHNQKLFKKRTIKNLQLVDSNWMPRQVTMNNIDTRRVTIMNRERIAFNLEVDNEYFTQRALTDFIFRERYLDNFRNFLKE